MNKEEAKNLVVKTFELSFDESSFLFFIKNLLNELDETKSQVWAGNYIPESFRGAIKSYKRLGQYTDKNKNTIDVLIVNVKRDNTLERARTLQRNFIARHLKQRNHEAALVAFYAEDYDDWRFSLVIMELNLTKTKVEIELSPAKRYSFLVGVNERSHTAQNQFVNLLSDKKDKHTLQEIEEAFNIETVTKEFFLEYRDLFIRTKKSLDKILSVDPRVKNEFAKKGVDSVNFSKKLLGQIVFLYFLQKKGWFGVPRDAKWGEGSKKFLRELLDGKHGKFDNFFNDILEPLFYQVLRVGEDRKHLDYYYSPFNCRIPFLNGGLFDPIGEYDWVHTDIIFPNELFSNNKKTPAGDIGDGILDIFDRYNFTVIEDEPLEKEVAIDPELLGKAYEKFNAIRSDNFDEYLKALKSGKKGEESKFNKQYGVYYTPREIVHYMCQQSLVNYLTTKLKDKASKEAIEFLIIEGDKFIEHLRIAKEKNEESNNYRGDYKEDKRFVELKNNADDLDKALSSVNVCDPAVGSGAFPVGMMSEIIKARMFFVLTNCLLGQYFNPHNDKVERNPYNYKRDCIENSLYGVDIDAGAVEIAKLRLWLSLVIDEEDINNIKPLPNLDYKITVGNSLLEVKKDLLNAHLFNELEKLKPLYFNETNPLNKQNYKAKIDDLIIRLSNGYREFDFEVYYSEVFHKKNGFDIIIANPPYITVALGKKQKFFTEEMVRIFKEKYKNVFEYKGNTFSLFFAKSISLLRKQGVLTFITPNTLLLNSTFSKTREFLLKYCNIKLLLNITDRVFEEAEIGGNLITIVSKNSIDNNIVQFKEIADLNEFTSNLTYELIKQEIFQSNKDFNFNLGNQFQSILFDKVYHNTLPLGKVVKFYQGIITGDNKKYLSNKKENNSYIKILRGRDIYKYYYCFDSNYVLFDKKKLWSNTNEEYFKFIPKLINRQTGDSLIAAYDDEGFFTLDSTHIQIPINSGYDIKYILALFNSKLLNFIYNGIVREQGRTFAQVKTVNLKTLPIKILSKNDQTILIKNIDRIINSKKQDPQAETKFLEDQIDIMIYKLYNLTYDEVKIIDPNIGEIISEEEYEKFAI